jgi:hypothetical protein
MKCNLYRLSDRIGPLQLTFGKEYDVTEYKADAEKTELVMTYIV